jgi:glycine cleavage system H protein
MTYPENFRFTKEHEWVLVEGETGTIGISFHAQKELGDIVYVDLPKVGATAEKGKTIGSVESVKAVSDIYAPVSGEVIAANELLTTSPEKLNEDPHGAAWLFKVKLSAPDELKDLMSAADYTAYAGDE